MLAIVTVNLHFFVVSAWDLASVLINRVFQKQINKISIFDCTCEGKCLFSKRKKF